MRSVQLTAIAISSLLWPSGLFSAWKILTATSRPFHRAASTSPDAPSPAAAPSGPAARVSSAHNPPGSAVWNLYKAPAQQSFS